MINLLPCPFCGGEARLVEGEESAYVQCREVKMHRAMFFDGDNDAANTVAEAWNRRALAAIPAADLAELTDPIAVHANMLRGTIAKPTVEQIIHLYGVDVLVKALATVIVREANPVNRPMMTDLMVDPEGITDMEMEYDHRAGAADE